MFQIIFEKSLYRNIFPHWNNIINGLLVDLHMEDKEVGGDLSKMLQITFGILKKFSS